MVHITVYVVTEHVQATLKPTVSDTPHSKDHSGHE